MPFHFPHPFCFDTFFEFSCLFTFYRTAYTYLLSRALTLASGCRFRPLLFWTCVAFKGEFVYYYETFPHTNLLFTCNSDSSV